MENEILMYKKALASDILMYFLIMTVAENIAFVEFLQQRHHSNQDSIN